MAVASRGGSFVTDEKNKSFLLYKMEYTGTIAINGTYGGEFI